MDKLYALDFDGVICDSVAETAVTGWKAAARLWADMPAAPSAAEVACFRQLRPLIETGYEAMLAMRLLFVGNSPAAIVGGYDGLAAGLLAEVQGGVAALKAVFAATRDDWMADDLAGWLAHNPLYPGVAEALKRLLETGAVCYVVTTKQQRFVQAILAANAVLLPPQNVFGLELNLSKPDILRGLLARHPGLGLCFVEDRLPTLEKVLATPALAGADLVFALWGYCGEADAGRAAALPVRPQTLAEFVGWLGSGASGWQP